MGLGVSWGRMRPSLTAPVPRKRDASELLPEPSPCGLRLLAGRGGWRGHPAGRKAKAGGERSEQGAPIGCWVPRPTESWVLPSPWGRRQGRGTGRGHAHQTFSPPAPTEPRFGVDLDEITCECEDRGTTSSSLGDAGGALTVPAGSTRGTCVWVTVTTQHPKNLTLHRNLG